MQNIDYKKMEDFLTENEIVLRNPILKSFISNKRNYYLIKSAIDNPTITNKAKVDNAFKIHYKEIKKVKYISSLIHFFSIDYDKKVRKLRERNLLILDKEVSYDNNKLTIKDQIAFQYSSFDAEFISNSLIDHIENDKLVEILKTLPSKQQVILELKYLHNFSLKEIAEIIGTSPQNISSQHKKALSKIYKKLTGE